MSQHDYNIANQGFPAFRTDLNNALSAIQTTNSGTSRPTGAVAGQLWLDTTSATTPTLKYYDGADDISLATIDHTANTVNWLDSTVSITGLSTTATGTVLTLSDTVNTTTVNLIIDNQKEIRFRETTANGTNYVALKAPASLSADLTFTLPSADGTNGQVLSTNGSGVLSFITPASGISWQSSVKTSGFTAVAGEGYFCNTTSSAFTVTLPASPSAGNQVAIVDYAGTFDTNKITLGRNGNKIEGATSDKQLSSERKAVQLVYIDATQGWLSSSASNETATAIEPLTYSVNFLVVAGGGSGGAEDGGGGGAGGFRTSTQTVSGGTVITVTVGDGGGIPSTNARGISGSDSSISGSGLTTITSAGGGGGGTDSTAGFAGGSGGGGSPDTTAGLAGNTPSTSPSQGNNGGNGFSRTGGSGTTGNEAGGGGGGASAVGGNASANNAGAGGAGTASSITGSSVTYAGGGGGGANGIGYSFGGAGGAGGGGAGTVNANATAGTANTGGGGGGSGANGSFNSGAGGKGVVILSVPTASYSGTSTGSPTITTSGSNTILQFTGSGSYTA